MEPIELATGDLLLRGWTDADADAVYRACQDPLIQRWTTIPAPYLPEHAAGFVGSQAPADWASATAAPLGIFDAASGELLGAHGLVRLDLAAGVAELGTWLAPWARGRGVAERATRAVARWALAVLALKLLVWRAEVGNHASRLVACRVGFTFDRPARAGLAGRHGELVDCWRGTLRPGEVRDAPPAWYAPGAAGSRRARTFAAPQPVLRAATATGGPVTLRPLTDADTDDVATACDDPEAARWTSVPAPYTRADAVSFVRGRTREIWAAGDGAIFALAGPDGRFAGSIHLEISLDDPAVGSIGYLVAPHARNQGYATAAVRAICAWGSEALGLTRIVWRAYVGNHASRRVAEKCGFTPEGIARAGCDHRGERRDAWVAALLATDADEARP